MFKRGLNRFLALTIAGVMTFSGVLVSGDKVYADEPTIEEVEQQKKEAEEKIEEAKTKLGSLEKEKEDVTALISDLDSEISDYRGKIDELNTEKNTLETEISLTEIKIQNALYDEQVQYDGMMSRIQYAYENDDKAYLDAIMNIDNYKNMLNNSEYSSQVSSYDQEQLNKLGQIRESINKYQDLLQDKKKEIERIKTETESEEQALEVMLDGKKELLGEYEESINVTEGEISELQAQTDAFDAQILELTQAAAAAEEARRQEELQRYASSSEDVSSAPSYYTGGTLQWPCPSSDYISSYFGGRSAPTAGASTYHQAIDIGCDVGSSVVSSEAGTVVETGYNVARGYYIIVYHGNNLSTLYQHLSSFAVGSGETVSRGQVIAYSGETGYCSGAHLHYEVIIGDERVDPLGYTSPY
ncbi:Septal ring factor EnvC, activator of murein hydrolases AmiA and AmiB [Eubacterium ruminantium]|uniref:Septal ring factor EnvC, activator of murein hydrolases AmiA and AmiB n=1 Tax=Eubacterium ruminantium TaxID=42322 RepID=A0A1T4LBD4_9FIRM|nr:MULTISPECIES: M23 family metallopeptidase [Eubacterium]MCR5368268.1 peptidoglycan DD-metalloendopeptidase family protein [Eubacterium sp.]SCW44726.1 Septal ring factor EnvC, activator of murein hydrolases AmiA and AmiB [Eubacterium ruminantium]SDM75794.1 Septal ring factor EnvC, activator of murein hydrolases AmiA and AmiB [Eubacterium ruminantium]SJZ51923.1 Septal ring factor EnvC, activator of murein hydrolases AmiA and AmiB [Eubacterium ruminantium]